MIINATQHVATAEQKAADVWDLFPQQRERLSEMITFEEVPSSEELEDRAAKVVAFLQLASGGEMLPKQEVMIGGAPYFMAPLERALLAAGASPVYAFSRRESVDQPQADGVVKKVAVFRHAGFVRVR